MEQTSTVPQDKDKDKDEDPLTTSEEAVACDVARSMSNKQIAHSRGKSVSTVETQVKSICHKWHCPTRVGVALGAIQHGLITMEEAIRGGGVLMVTFLLSDGNLSSLLAA